MDAGERGVTERAGSPTGTQSVLSGMLLHGGRVYSTVYQTLVMALALLYGAVFSQTPSEQFKDFGNYLIYAEHSWLRLLGLLNQGILETLLCIDTGYHICVCC